MLLDKLEVREREANEEEQNEEMRNWTQSLNRRNFLLQVNWSVPQIRKQFQLSAADAVPPVIDTLYAKLPTTANGGNTNKQPAAATAMVVGAVGGPK